MYDNEKFLIFNFSHWRHIQGKVKEELSQLRICLRSTIPKVHKAYSGTAQYSNISFRDFSISKFASSTDAEHLEHDVTHDFA